jgi:Leucine-rich repeat (LRR) protein
MQNLKSLILAHNRITSLQPLKDLGEYSKLETLDLVDNYVSSLNEVKHLSSLRHLRKLLFENGKERGSNPICDLDKYGVTVRMYCLGVVELDGRSV